MFVKFRILRAMILWIVPIFCWAELKNENLLQTLPQGYKVDYQAKQSTMLMTEMVPQNESVNQWSEMVTTQVFFNMKVTPSDFQARMQTMWAASCQGAEFVSLRQGEENGYAFSFWMQVCPLNQATGKPEITWFKAIQGNDSFYVVQKAFKFMPTNEQVVAWTQYLKSVQVCDTRIKGRECPLN